LTGPGYNSLPNFTLTSGTLSTIAQAPFGGGSKLYNSTVVEAGKELQFLASTQPAGNLALDGNYVLTVDGEKEGWTICDGALDTRFCLGREQQRGVKRRLCMQLRRHLIKLVCTT
jgi:hypothetical protein